MTDQQQTPDRPSRSRASALAAQMQQQLAELEVTSRELRHEIRLRTDLSVADIQRKEPESEEAALAELLEQARVNWGQVKTFFEDALNELRTGKSSWDNPLNTDQEGKP